MMASKSKSESGLLGPYIKVAVFIALLSTGCILYFAFADLLNLESLVEHETTLRQFQDSHPISVFALAIVIYVAVTGLSLPGAAVLSVVYAWYFGFFEALVVVSVSSTAGATIAFLLSRYLFRGLIEKRFGDRLASFNENLERDGAFYLFSLRLIPAVPFFLINIVMGLTPIRVSTFWWVSQVGMLPGTIVFVFFGSSVPDLKTLSEKGLVGILRWELMVAFILLGVTPLIIKKTLGWYSGKRKPPADKSTDPS